MSTWILEIEACLLQVCETITYTQSHLSCPGWILKPLSAQQVPTYR